MVCLNHLQNQIQELRKDTLKARRGQSNISAADLTQVSFFCNIIFLSVVIYLMYDGDVQVEHFQFYSTLNIT
jgi:hypothetical protein